MNDEVGRRFAELEAKHGKWLTKHTIDDIDYGGEIDFRQDYRYHDFLQFAKPEGRILEISCFEGGHTRMLAQLPNVESVHGIDARDYLVGKAKGVVDLLGLRNVTFSVCNVDTPEILSLGTFDCIFCCGLMYHLRDPWVFLSRCAKISKKIYISTHYADAAKVRHGAYSGFFWTEQGFKDPLSGMGDYSFWPVFPDLLRMISDNGMYVEYMHNNPHWSCPGGKPHNLILPLVNLLAVVQQ